VTLSDVTFCWPCGGWLHNPDSKFGEEGKNCFMPTKCMELLSMVDRLDVAKTEQLLAEREKEPDIGWHNSNLKCDCMEPSFKSKRTKRQILMLQ